MKTKWILFGLLAIAIALGVVFLKRDRGTSELGSRAYSLTEEILAFGPRPPGSEALDQVRAHLKQELEAAGWAVVLQEFERGTPIGTVRFANFRARLRTDGEDPWKRQVAGLLCAHIDSKYYEDKEREFLGADDAASACAAVIELGKQLAREKPNRARQLELVLFDGEEAFAPDMTVLDGLYGSRFYANTWRSRDDKPRFGILLDMIGHKDLSIRIPSDSPPHLARTMFAAAKKEGVESHFGTAPGEIMDDHVPLNLIGIPTIDIIGDFSSKSWWHTAGDNIGIISPESLGISMRVVLRMLDELLEKQ